MSAGGGNFVFGFGLWIAVGLSAVFAVNRIERLSHRQPGPIEQPARVGAAEPASERPARPFGDGVELRADRAGHYRSEMEVNGRSMQAMIDTGATVVALTFEDGERTGVHLHDRDFTGRMMTANGLARYAPVMLDRVSIGNIVVHNVQAAVAERGVLRDNLLGMSFLQKLNKFEVASGRMILQ